MAEVTTPRIVVVTGASRGIGAACAAAFAAQGDVVVGLSRTSGSTPDGVEYVSCDLTDAEAVEGAFGEVIERHGRIDVLVANAGITRDQLAVRMSDEDFSAVVETNLVGTFRCARVALKRMIRQRSGAIVMVSSVGAFMGLPGQANYAASKAGIVGMARALAREVGSRSITVNVIAPGLIATEMTDVLGGERLDAMAAQVPLGRVGEAEEVAAAAVFLASPGAAYITGAVLSVDGGLGMGH